MADGKPWRSVLLFVILGYIGATTFAVIANTVEDVGERRLSDIVPLEKLANFQNECSTRCPYQNKTDMAEGPYDVGCGTDCNIQQCSRGCRSWQLALDSSCQIVCNGTEEPLTPKELYCVMGCNDALSMYYQRLREELGTPPAPALVADSLTATSLSLEWEGPRLIGSRYLVQWRYEELSAAWQFCCNQSWGPRSTVRVDNLQPYTKYRFRVALLLEPPPAEPLVSAPSVVISTLPHGVPASPPTIVRAAAVDPGRISVSWEAGAFPNGPILSYVLQIRQLPDGNTSRKDFPATGNTDFYMFQHLASGQRYNVSVAMRNAVGEGPAAAVVLTTPSAQEEQDAQQAVLVLCASHTVTRQSADMLDEPGLIYNSSETITGVALHVRLRQLFVADVTGAIRRVPLNGSGAPRLLLQFPRELGPHQLSVDWLNDLLYVVADAGAGGWQVARIAIDGPVSGGSGRGLTVAVAGLPVQPLHIEVDPYNGFLFLAMSGGLYRLDLADISNGVKHEARPVQLLAEPHIGAFVVDHTNFRLLVTHRKLNTVLAVSLDGSEVSDVRNNTQQPMFAGSISLACANGLFYWTDGDEVLAEEYHAGQNSYYHNAFPEPGGVGGRRRRFLAVLVDLPTAQPIPVPVNPPTSVQAVLGSNIAKVSWHQPHLLGGQGKGAWQNWSFVVDVREAEPNSTNSPMVLERRGIRGTWCALRGLRPGKRYVVRAAAYSSAGVGPWSAEFRGTSLRLPAPGRPAPAILWSAADGLLRSDVTGDDVRSIVHRDSLRDSHGPFHIADMAWYEDRMYLVANTTQVYCYNTSSRTLRRLRHVDSAGSIAVDWLGGRLYTSNPKQQLISRSLLDGSLKEPLPILTVAKELNIDAVHAYIYWSTGHAVEVARLNGKARRTYFPPELFSGKHVMGLTLDLDSRAVYWVVRSYEGASLYKAPTAESLEPGEVQPTRISKLQHPSMQGPLSYLSDHLLWLQDDRNAVIADLNGQSAAEISGMALSGLHTVAAWDPDLHRVPVLPSKEKISVIPASVRQASIRVVGTWQTFNVTWDPVRNVNFGQVFYEVKIRSSVNNELVQETTQTAVRCCGPLSMTNKTPMVIPPHSELHVAVRAITFWGSSGQVSVLLRSPPARPGPPQHPRVFITFEGDSNLPLDKQVISALFRWDPPAEPNGELSHYVVRYWRVEPDGDIPPVVVGAQHLEFQAHKLEPNYTYYFQVQAFTPAGGGAYSEPVAAWSAAERPVPRLLVATADALLLADCDRGGAATALRHVTSDTAAAGGPVDMAVLLRQRQLLWLSGSLELRMAHIDGSNLTKVAALSGPALAVAADWVGRTVYWAEQDEDDTTSTLFRLPLDGPGIPSRVLRRPGIVRSLSVAPLTSTLIWVEQNIGEDGFRSRVMAASTDGSSVRPFFGARRGCTCGSFAPTNVAPAVTIDHTGGGAPRVLWADLAQGNVFAADTDGCRCDTVLLTHMAGTHIVSIAADQTHVYWTNGHEGKIYAAGKSPNGSAVAQFDLRGVRRVTAIGPNLQPFPAQECLAPLRPQEPPVATARTSTSVTLILPAPRRPAPCNSVTLAATIYTVFYATADSQGCPQDTQSCFKMVSAEQRAEITGLQPFTQYIFAVAITNFYSDGLQLGPPTFIWTEAGAPTPPRKVNVRALDPSSIRVTWQPPERLHSASVLYELHWRAEGPGLGEHTSGQQLVGGGLTSTLYKLAPDQNYLIWVSARADSAEAHSDSPPQLVRTMPRPNPISLVQSDPYALTVSWTPSPNVSVTKCELLYSIAGSTEWVSHPISWNPSTTPLSPISIPISPLEPKTRYTFRLGMLFPEAEEMFVWPSEGGFTFETLGDRPSAPGIPTVQPLHRDVYQVTWKKSRDNGAPILVYTLEGWMKPEIGERGRREAEVANNSVELQPEWETLYNGTESFWIVHSLEEGAPYVFRVRALNSYGWSDWSQESNGKDLGAAALLAKTQEVGIVLAVTMTVGVVTLCGIALLIVVVVSRRRQKHKKALQAGGCVSSVGGHHGGVVGGPTVVLPRTAPDVELATLRELPRRANFIHRANTLYSLGDNLGSPEDDLVSVPRISRHQITLTKFLGSGAFGEVFEGNARGVPEINNEAETRVAIKTLRKGATEQEKAEFLKEAQLMSHFRHAHILQLLGVCLDNDPNFIIMELMEAGDLLSFLRSRRPPGQGGCVPLTLPDLLALCVDVARGCRYLEEMHFVHRDLAARNCLVSSSDPQTRVVKIGDFGLARDIYKNDYYRKEGEGMLPVRWMAPESLVDGVFTSQSDVWAFGVLLWEVITMGQQPYPARANIEVLHYVRAGGLPGRPSNCPDQMHQLMVKCWQYSPDARPTFKYCLQVLEDLKANGGTIAGTPVPSVPTHHFISRTINGGFSNRAFFEDENHNSSGDSWKTSSDGSRDQEPFLQRNSTTTPPVTLPKYLELIYDVDEDANPRLSTSMPVPQTESNASQPGNTTDGYEIPRQPPITSPQTQDTRIRTLSTSSTVSDTSVASSQQLVLPPPQTIVTGTE